MSWHALTHALTHARPRPFSRYIEPESLNGNTPAGVSANMAAEMSTQSPEWLESEKAMLRQELQVSGE